MSQFLALLDVKKTALRIIWADKTKRKAIYKSRDLWYSIHNQKGDIKINTSVKKDLSNWLLYNPQVVQYPISNNFLNVAIDGETEK